jgi:hypothetical protein
MISRLVAPLAVLVAALALAGTASASAPFWTQKPTLSVEGGQLYAANGSWASYSGPVTHYVFRFVRDGATVQGPDSVPRSTTPDVIPVNTYPLVPNAMYYTLTSADNGHCFVAQVWGGIRSTYQYADGTYAYDLWEWGSQSLAGEGATTNQVCIGGTPTPPPAPTPPAPAPTPPPPPPPPPPPKLAFVGSPTAKGMVGLDYVGQFAVQNGTSVSYALAAGSLPPGLSLSTNGVVTGTPTKAGFYTFTVRATDPIATAVEGAFSLQIDAPTLVIAPQILRGCRANQPYTQQLSVFGGYAPYTYSVLAGELPKGLELSADGTLAGTPDAPAGQYAFTVGTTDKYGLTARLDLVFTVLPPKMSIDTATIANAVRGRVYTASIVASGGSEPYTFSVVSGKLPPGIKLAPDGTIGGRPTRAGGFGFTVQATDANGVTRMHYYGLRVRQPLRVKR